MEYLAKRWRHQIDAEEKAIEHYRTHKDVYGYAFFMSPGVGKTLTMINTLRRIINEEKRMLRVLIFAPPIVCPNWKDEFKKYSKIDPKNITVLIQGGKRRLKSFVDRAFNPTDQRKQAHIFITNYESVTGKIGGALDDLFHKILEWSPEILILDESHKIKDGSSKRAKKIDRIANPFDHKLKVKPIRPKVFLLTGSPILNSPMDIFSQFLALDGGETFGSNFFQFRARFFEDKNANMPRHRHFPNWQIKKGSIEVINEKISKKSITAFKEDCLDLPPLLQQTILLDMTNEQKTHYESMRKDLITFINMDACTAELAIVKALRLMQISSGFVRTEDKKDHALKENPKEEALKELLMEIAPHHKVIVWAIFKYDYQRIKKVCSELGFPMVSLHGGMLNTVRTDNVKKFNTDKNIRVLVGHPRSGGIGINLASSNYSIFYSRNFSLEDRIQSEARNYRGGSEMHEKITHIDLVMRDTIEEKVMDSLKKKQQIGFSLLKEIV